MKDIKTLMTKTERLTKAGNIHLTVRDNKEEANALEYELLFDYETIPGKVLLKVKMPDGSEYVYTESDLVLREFKENVLGIGTTPDTNTYSPRIYYKVPDVDPKLAVNFYNELKNGEFTPYLNYVNEDGVTHALIPYMNTDHVYIDISEVFEGEEDIRTVTEILAVIVAHTEEIRDRINENIDMLSDMVTDIDNTFTEINDKHDAMFDELEGITTSNQELINNLVEKVEQLINDTERAVRPKMVTISGVVGTVVPILVMPGTGRDITSIFNEQINSSIYIVCENNEVVVKIGNDLGYKSGVHAEVTAVDFTIIKNKADATWIYDVRQLNSSTFLIYLKPGTYTFLNKHIETLEITESPTGYSPVPDTTVLNGFINGPNYKDIIYTKRFSEKITVAKSLHLGAKVEIFADMVGGISEEE